ncbi:MAG TPA: N-6 DNA methylase [Verrucomicrobiae bacterium]|nr:N-6 DNA methylase [Verrucomicrobiae bacterium]
MNAGNAEEAARQAGTSPSSLSQWRSGHSRPAKHLEERLRAIVGGTGDLFSPMASRRLESRLDQLEEAIAATLHSLREEFHRTATISTRQESLDLVAGLVFAHVTSIDSGGAGIGEGLLAQSNTAVAALNDFIQAALAQYLPQKTADETKLGVDRFFTRLSAGDERFAYRLIQIFEHDGNAFRALHEAGRDDLINEVFSRFMSNSFVDEKEMGQYLTPPEITRFMVEVGFHALSPDVRAQLLDENVDDRAGVILDPSCGVGSFLAESTRFFHGQVRQHLNEQEAGLWLLRFVSKHVVGIDKSERMIRLAMINLGLFGAKTANLCIANALDRVLHEGCLTANLEEKVQLILTNPPFGATYTGTDISSFAMGRGRARAESEVLFLERYVDWLAPGGIAVTVVPDSVLVNRGVFAELRSWLRTRCYIEAVFSLPSVTFAAAGTSTKTSVIVLRKYGRQATEPTTYFGGASEVGFDVITRSGQRRRVRSSRTDLPTLLAEYRREMPENLGGRRRLPNEAERWDPAYHVGLPENIAAVLDRPEMTLLKVSDVAKLIDERIDPRQRSSGEFNYVEISDVDTRTGLVGHKQLLAADAPSRARKLIRAGDVLVSTVRPERGGVGITPPGLDCAVCSTGFAVIRCFGIHPLALVWLLKTEVVREQMIRNNSGIAYPAISEQTILKLVLPARRESIASLSAAAEGLAGAQERFEKARMALIAEVCALDQAGLSHVTELGESPDLVDGSEPSAVADSA